MHVSDMFCDYHNFLGKGKEEGGRKGGRGGGGRGERKGSHLTKRST